MNTKPCQATAQAATIAAIRVSLDHLGAATAPEHVVKHLRRFDLAVSTADVEAVKAQQFLAQTVSRDGAQSEDSPPDEAWRVAEVTSTHTLSDAQRLLSTAGSVDLAKHTLEVADHGAPNSRDRQPLLPPDDVPNASGQNV